MGEIFALVHTCTNRLSLGKCEQPARETAQGRGLRYLVLVALLTTFAVGAGPACLQVECADADAFCNPVAGYVLYRTLTPQASRIYWIRANSPRSIMRANIDGTGIESVGGVFASGPASLVVDSVGGHIYYTEDGTDWIRRANLDGSNDFIFATDSTAAETIGLILDRSRNRLYWFNNSDQLRYVNLSDGSGQTNVRDFLSTAKLGVFEIAGNRFFSGGDTFLLSMPDDGLSEQQIDNTYSNIVDLDLAADDQLYISDLTLMSVFLVNRDGTARTAITSGFTPGGAGYDAAGGRIFVCDLDNARILRANPDGTDSTTLLSDTPGSQPVACSLEFAGGL